MTIVRPFRARLVRPEWAPRAVTALTDSYDTGADSLRVAPDPAAYEEAEAAFYVYRQGGDAGSHTGVVCEVAIQAFADGHVREHEAVDTRRVEALVRHHVTTTDPPALVALLHRAGPAYTRALDATCRTAPILDFPGPDGLRQTVWRMAEGTADAMRELAVADHYIADGHHRVAAAVEEWRRGGSPAEAGLLCVLYPMDGLRLSAFHRRVTGPVDQADLRTLLTPEFHVQAVARPPSPTSGSFGLYVGGGWFDVRHRAGRGGGPPRLDIEVLQDRILEGMVGLTPSNAVEIAPARTSLGELVRRCDADGGALFTLAPPSLEALTNLADTGAVMPAKTTYFEPKPCAGIFLRASSSDAPAAE